MFQTFDSPTRPGDGPPRLEALRREIAAEGLDGFLVPRADAHQGEYVPPRDARLAWLTGFTGSAGFCAVLADRAGVFIDGRYRVQVKAEVAASHFTPVPWPETALAGWLTEALPQGGRIGFDAWLHTAGEIAKLETALQGTGIALVALENLVDRVWSDRPPPPSGPVRPWPESLAGESAASKRRRLGADLAAAGQAAAVLTLPDSIAWLLNIRGSDLPRVPVALGFAVLHAGGDVDLYLTPGREIDLGPHPDGAVRIRAMDDLAADLAELPGKVRVDRDRAPLAVSRLLRQPVWGADPCILPKARKTPAELAGAAEAQLRDGAAMVAFLAWLDAEAPKGKLTEIAVVSALEGFRRATNALQDLSFDTICGSGPNGAIVHYRVTRASDRRIRPGELLLVDSGGQYLDGTTDITRTVAVGEVGPDEKTCFTRVLKGMIAISRIRFPKGVGGQHLDALARAPLWLAGQDYDHGTGHGVGAFLSVHEGPAGLSRRSEAALEPGMILSNEPGYYREGAFGIRIENLIVVEEAPPLPGGDTARQMLGFRTLTFVPIDRRLVLPAMLDPDERAWLDAYHRKTLAMLGDRVEAGVRGWLELACAPI